MPSLQRAVCRVLLSVLGVAFAPMAGAEIYKCVDRGGGVAYQSWPCGSSAAETTIATATRAPPSPAVSAPPARIARCRPPWRHCTLTLGMSDDEVLNLAGWGRPDRIARGRLPREWHEEWIYGEGTPYERRLRFANARLVDIVVSAPGAERFAALPARGY